MKLRPEQIKDHLKKQLLPIYIAGGEEPFLLQQAADQIKQVAKQNDFLDHQVFHIEKGFDWNRILEETGNLSLFGDKKFIDIRLPTSKPGDQGGKVIQKICESTHSDTLILITAGKLDKATLSRKWMKALDAVGAVIQVWPLSQDQFPQWVSKTLSSHSLPNSGDIIELICSRTEGNLLAANQEIEKLKLLNGNNDLDIDAVRESVANSSRYDAFVLADECLKRKPDHALKVLNGLKEEGAEPILILWSLVRDVRALLELSVSPSDSLTIFRRHKIFGPHQKLVLQNTSRFNANELNTLLALCHSIDLAMKGVPSQLPVWQSLTELVLRLSGAKIQFK